MLLNILYYFLIIDKFLDNGASISRGINIELCSKTLKILII